ncbi:integrase/recombinase xerD homolog [Saccostrea cucullata]|uniref:integrase/recombinase xerD homolog n=1 Tax=Saccostrea cuccullata TaxID=36930 RepID=UPI002ED1013D
MPPKRKQTPAKNPTKRQKMATKQPEVTPQPTTAIEHPEVIPGPAYGQIDYNKLAEAMLAISKQQPENAPSQNTSDDRQMPVTLESPSTSQSAEPATTSTLGTLLDQIFLGDRSTHKDLSPLRGLQDSTSLESQSNSGAQGPLVDLSPISRQLLTSSLSSSTALAYRKSWQYLLKWKPGLSLPISVTDVCNFIGVLFSNNYSPSSILSHMSAISFVHKICNMSDPTQAFVVKKILKGCQTLGPRKDTRLPITAPILQRLVQALDHTVKLFSLRVLFRAVFLMAFHAFLRLGELTVKSAKGSDKVLQREDVTFEHKSNSIVGVQIIMREYKTNKHNKPLVIYLQASPNSQYCPVQALSNYVQTFNHKTGPLFQTMDGSPVSYSLVTTHLKTAIQFIGLDTDSFKGHSFRIGAATHAASLGYSEQVIQKLGRWNSDAFRRYIRIQSFKI